MTSTNSSIAHAPNKSLTHQNFSLNQYLLFALELDVTQRWSSLPGQITDGERAALAAGLDINSYRELRQQLKNTTHKKFDVYMSDITFQLERHGIKVDKSFITQHRHLFFDGQLAASDALEGSLQKSTLTLISNLLKKGIWHTAWGLEEIGKNTASVKIIDQSKELESVFRWGKNDIGFHSIQFLNMAIAGLGHERLRSPEYARELFRAVGHGNMWAPELCLKILNIIYPKSLAEESKKYAQDADPQVRDGAVKLMEKNQGHAMRCAALF